MPKICSKLGYVCPDCGLDYGWEETIVQKSTRKRGIKNKQRVLSKRRTDDERIHITKVISKPVESGLHSFITDVYDKAWLGVAADGLLKSLYDGTWNRMSVQDQDYILREISKMKTRIESREKEDQEDELKHQKWDFILTERNTPYYELSQKVSSLYKDPLSTSVKSGPARVNSVLEIKKYRRTGDPLRHLYIDKRHLVRVLFKYPLILQRIREQGKEPLIRNGWESFNEYRKPFSNARWMYPWIEQFWICIYAHAVSARQASRMIEIIDAPGGWKVSAKHIRNRIEPTIGFWQDFFEYVPHFLRYIDFMQYVMRNDLELSKIYQLEKQKSDEEIENDIEEIGRTHLQRLFKDANNSSAGLHGFNTKQGDTSSEIASVTRISKEMIRVRHPNLNYRKEMQEFREGIRTEKPKRKTSSCYFDPWKKGLDVIAQLLKKGKIHLI